jgi:CheY-like chemotaxis protein
MIRVLLADDQALVRAGFRALLDAQDDIEVVGEAGDGEAALRMVADLTPDLVLMDIRMPGLDGLSATRQIAADERLASVRVPTMPASSTTSTVCASRPSQRWSSRSASSLAIVPLGIPACWWSSCAGRAARATPTTRYVKPYVAVSRWSRLDE